MPRYALTPDGNTDRTALLARIELPPKRLVDRFGPPAECDHYKVSGHYTFSDVYGNVFTLYDWKATTLYDDNLTLLEESDVPTPDEFWANEFPEPLHIGGRKEAGNVEDFMGWLREQLAEEPGR